MSKASSKHVWTFASRFRRGAFGWRSDPAITRIKEALAEIKAVNRKEPMRAAEERAYDLTLQAADTAQGTASALTRIQQILNSFPQERFARGALAKTSGLSGDFR